MTVRELIELLQQCEPNAFVFGRAMTRDLLGGLHGANPRPALEEPVVFVQRGRYAEDSTKSGSYVMLQTDDLAGLYRDQPKLRGDHEKSWLYSRQTE